MAQIPRAHEGIVCPFHKADCSDVCHTCPLWTQIRGTNPNPGEPVDDWRCAVAWLPVLLVENSQMQRQTGAAVEDFRNELVRGVVDAVGAAAEQAGRQIDARHHHR